MELPPNKLLRPLISAITAGNTAILKPSAFTPNVNTVPAEMIHEAFSPNEIMLTEGEASTANALLDLPFDHIFFTGSPAIGGRVMEPAARHLTSVTLELDGKLPVVIDESADLERAAEVVI